MRLAVLTDIHANREALAAVQADISRRGVDRLAVLGDIVGYGADPAWCVDTVARLVADGAIAVQGNHDAAVATPDPAMSANAAAALAWTIPQLDPTQRAFLAGLPLTCVIADRLFVHANGWSPRDWGYVRTAVEAERSLRSTTARITLVGHTHVPMLYHMTPARPPGAFVPVPDRPVPLVASCRWLAVVGAVGQPRDGNPSACYALLEDGPPPTFTLVRVPYDHVTAAAKIRAAGLPDALAVRLAQGR